MRSGSIIGGKLFALGGHSWDGASYATANFLHIRRHPWIGDFTVLIDIESAYFFWRQRANSFLGLSNSAKPIGTQRHKIERKRANRCAQGFRT